LLAGVATTVTSTIKYRRFVARHHTGSRPTPNAVVVRRHRVRGDRQIGIGKKLEWQTIIIVRRVTFKDEGPEMALVLGICQ